MAQSRELPIGQDWFIERMQSAGHNVTLAGVCRGRAIYETMMMFSNNIDSLDANTVNHHLAAVAAIPVADIPKKIQELNWKRNELALKAKEEAFKELTPELQKKAVSRQLNSAEQRHYESVIQQNWQKNLAQIDNPIERAQLDIPAYFRGVELCRKRQPNYIF